MQRFVRGHGEGEWEAALKGGPAPPRERIPDGIFEAAWEDGPNRGIYISLAKRFARRLGMDWDDAMQVCRLALWDSLSRHDFAKGNRFTSSLHNWVVWRFRRHGEELDRERQKHVVLPPDSGLFSRLAYKEKVTDEEEKGPGHLRHDPLPSLSCLGPVARSVVEARYLEGVSLNEIAKRTNKKSKDIRRILKKCLEKLRKKNEDQRQ